MAAAGGASADAATVDAFLGGRLEAVQPVGGHRSGLEALLVSAAVESAFAGTVVDLGAGAGVAGFAVAARCPRARVVLVERDPEALACARASLALPANCTFAERVSAIAGDIAAPEAMGAAGALAAGSADMVIANPPFNDARATTSPRPARADAHVLGEGGLDPWLRAAAWLLKPRGHLAVIFRADGLDELLAACRGRFGALDVLPVQPRADDPAHRVVVRAVKASRAPLRLLPALVLHEAGESRFTPNAEAVLRAGAGLFDAAPPR